MKFLQFLGTLLKVTLWIVIPAALAIGGLYIYSQTKDWNKEADAIAQEVQRTTGRKLFIKGGVDFAFFPRPTLTLKDARLDNLPGAATESLAIIPQLIVTPSILSLITGTTSIDDMTLVSPIIALEILPDGRKSWDLTINRSPIASAVPLPIAQITLKDASLKAYNKQSNYETRLAKISGVIVPQGIEGAMKFNGTITRAEKPVDLMFETGALVSQGAIPLSLEIKSGASDVTLKGNFQNIGSASPQFAFTLDGTLDQILLPFGERLTRPADARVKISAQISGGSKQLTLSKLNLDGASVAGLGEGYIDLTHPRPSLKINLLLSQASLAAKQLLPEGAVTLTPTATPEQAAANPSYRVGDIGFGKYNEINLLSDVDMVVDIGITQAKFQDELVHDMRLNINSVQGGGLELRNLSMSLPGDATVEAKGNITDDGTVDNIAARFTGNVRVTGNSLKGFLRWLKVDLPPLPEDKLNAFAASANIIFSKHEMNIPALVARFDDTTITGGNANVSNDPTKPSQIALTMENLNLDLYLPKLEDLIKREGGSAQEAQYEQINAMQRKFDFLRVVESSFGATDMSFTVNNLIYKGEKVTKAASRIRFGSAQLELSDIDVIAQDVQMRGKIQIDASGLRPKINADLEVDDFNTADIPGLRLFFIDKQAAAAPASETGQPQTQAAISERWSRDLLDLHDMQAYDGKAKLFFHSLTHQNVRFENVSMQLHSQENFIYADSIRGTVFDGGKFDGKAVLNIATQPTLSLSFALSNAGLNNALQELFGFKAATEGRFSVSGSISTMGTDIRTMVSRLEGGLSIVLRGARIQGFDLVSLTQSLSQILSAKQMRDLADAALLQNGPGSMYYDYAAGTATISSGTIVLKDFLLYSPNFPPLNLTGNVNLAAWNYDMLAKTGLPLGQGGGYDLRRTAAESDVPLYARIQGSIDNPTITWDKNSIQTYWEKRFYH